MSRTILLTGPELAAEAMNLAAEQGVRIVPLRPTYPPKNWKRSFALNSPMPSWSARAN